MQLKRAIVRHAVRLCQMLPIPLANYIYNCMYKLGIIQRVMDIRPFCTKSGGGEGAKGRELMGAEKRSGRRGTA